MNGRSTCCLPIKGGSKRSGLLGQLALLIAIGPLLVVPMESGSMLFKPLRAMNDAQAVNLLIGHDARLIRKANGDGSLYIEGRPWASLLPA